MVQLIECVVWECVDPIHERFGQKPGMPYNMGDSGIFPLGQIRRKSGFDHINDHRQKNPCFFPRRDIMAEIEYPGIAKLVSRLVWENTTSRINKLNNRV